MDLRARLTCAGSCKDATSLTGNGLGRVSVTDIRDEGGVDSVRPGLAVSYACDAKEGEDAADTEVCAIEALRCCRPECASTPPDVSARELRRLTVPLLDLVQQPTEAIFHLPATFRRQARDLDETDIMLLAKSVAMPRVNLRGLVRIGLARKQDSVQSRRDESLCPRLRWTSLRQRCLLT